MEITYNESLIMPANYAVINDEEMTYIDGGSTTVVYGTASNIKTRLSSIITCAILGVVDGAALGALVGGPLGAVAGALVADALCQSWFNTASPAHNVVEGIISRYGKNRRCKMTTTAVWGLYFTGISVELA